MALAAGLPSGNKDSLQLFLETSVAESPVLPAHNDALVAFDNQQIIGRQYSLTAYKHPPISTCTAFDYAFCSESVLQLSFDMQPEHFLGIGHSRTGSTTELLAATCINAEEAMIATQELKQLLPSCSQEPWRRKTAISTSTWII